MRRLRVAVGSSTITLIALAATLPLQAQQIEFADWAVAARTYMLPDELARLAEITTVEQANELMERFWQRRESSDPDAPAFRSTFHERLAYADKEFGAQGERGALTPRGQIWMLLGSPTRTGKTFRRFRVNGALRPLEIWEYEDSGSSGRTLRFVFAHTTEGVKFVVENPRIGLPHDLRDGLADARATFVRQLIPLGPVDIATETRPLEIGGSVVSRGATLVALLEMDPRVLLGEPRSDGILFRLEVELLDRLGAVRQLGTVDLPMTAPMLDRLGTGTVRIMASVPGGADAEALRILEPLSGRSVTLLVVSSDAPPTPEEVTRFLSVASLGEGGIAYAYLGPCTALPSVARLVAVETGPGLEARGPLDSRGVELQVVRLVAARE